MCIRDSFKSGTKPRKRRQSPSRHDSFVAGARSPRRSAARIEEIVARLSGCAKTGSSRARESHRHSGMRRTAGGEIVSKQLSQVVQASKEVSAFKIVPAAHYQPLSFYRSQISSLKARTEAYLADANKLDSSHNKSSDQDLIMAEARLKAIETIRLEVTGQASRRRFEHLLVQVLSLIHI